MRNTYNIAVRKPQGIGLLGDWSQMENKKENGCYRNTV